MEILPLIIILIIGLSLNKKIKQVITMKENGANNIDILKKFKSNPNNLIKNIFNELTKEIARQKKLTSFNFKENLHLNEVKAPETNFKSQQEKFIKKPERQITEKQSSYDKRIIFILPFLLVLLSLIVSKVKLGGTIMSNLYGWPYPFLIHQVKDVVDGFLIDKWFFTLGSAYHYIIFNYLFFLVIVFIIYSFIKANNKK